MRNAVKCWLESLKKRDHLGDLGADGKIILKWILGKHLMVWLDSSGSGQGTVAGCYEHSNEPSDSIKDGEFD
jgi:hypothetical protein